MIHNCAFVGCDMNHFTAFTFGGILWPDRSLIVICLTFMLYDFFILDCTMNCHFHLFTRLQNILVVSKGRAPITQWRDITSERASQCAFYRVIKRSLCTGRLQYTQLMSWRWPSQNTFGMWTELYWTRSSRTQFGMSINVWRLAGGTLNISCNCLYCIIKCTETSWSPCI